jgi:diadenosine tetraphosphatase ApaH/serine/threonine PP2A family protein phosphatase
MLLSLIRMLGGTVLLTTRPETNPPRRTRRPGMVLVAFLCGVALLSSAARAQSVPAPAAAFDDGPHIYWANMSNAFVFYVCGGQFKMEHYRVAGTLSFRGLCADSLVERSVAARAPKPDAFEFTGASRILTVSDIHGEYDALVAFLRKAGVIDDALHWAWGDGHLVVLGDVFDRGDHVTEILWLVYRLEGEAKQAGGAVHYLLGNHEMMVMQGDLRYTNEKYLGGIVKMTGIKYPDLFGPDTELGRWLRRKPVAVRIDDVLFVHGGLGPAEVERGLSLADINGTTRAAIDMSSAALFFSDLPFFLIGSEGPLWYRGYFGAEGTRYDQITPVQLDSVLAFYGTKAVVVGHTENGVAPIKREYGGKVYGVDVIVEQLGGFEGLLWKGGTFFRVRVDGTVEPFTEQAAPVTP